MRTALSVRRRHKVAADVPAQASRTCPHGIGHPSWCPTCKVHWEARMRHPSWPRVSKASR